MDKWYTQNIQYGWKVQQHISIAYRGGVSVSMEPPGLYFHRKISAQYAVSKPNDSGKMEHGVVSLCMEISHNT